MPERDGICYCSACGSVNEEFSALLGMKEDAIRDLENELRVKRATISRLKKAQSEQNEFDPHYEPALEVFEYWKARLSPGAREFNGKRWENVVARLRAGATVDELKKAVDGVRAFPYVTERGRSKTGSPKQRQADLELICRSEPHVRRFMSYIETEEEQTSSDLIPPKRVLAWQAAIDKPQILSRLKELRGWSAEAILELGLGIDGGRVVFLAHDAEGRLTGVARYQPNPAKRQSSKNLAQGARELFPPPEQFSGANVWLVEGEPDAVAMRTMGLPAVSVPGVATWKQGWAERFERFDRVYVCFDCDDEGRKAAAIRVGQLGKVTTAMPVDLGRDDGYDLNDLLLEKGESAASTLSSLATVTSGAVTPFQPRIDSDPPYERVKRALEAADCRVTETGQGRATSTCPNHEDRHPSLSLSEGDGKALIHCHAGCEPEQIVRALGLNLHDLFQKAV